MNLNLVLRNRLEPGATTCVVCRDADGVVAVCRGCGTTTHTECAAESRGCPTLGCARRDLLPVARLSDQHVVLRLARPRHDAPTSLVGRLLADLSELANRPIPAQTSVPLFTFVIALFAATCWIVCQRHP